MKRTYIIPNTESVSFRSGYICAASPAGDPGMNVGGGTLGGGTEAPIPTDPM